MSRQVTVVILQRGLSQYAVAAIRIKVLKFVDTFGMKKGTLESSHIFAYVSQSSVKALLYPLLRGSASCFSITLINLYSVRSLKQRFPGERFWLFYSHRYEQKTMPASFSTLPSRTLHAVKSMKLAVRYRQLYQQ
jgi:hypothetical protein